MGIGMKTGTGAEIYLINKFKNLTIIIFNKIF